MTNKGIILPSLFIFLIGLVFSATASATVWTGEPIDWSVDNHGASVMVVYNDNLYVGTTNYVDGSELWKFDGASWTMAAKASADFGIDASEITAMAVYDGKLFVAVMGTASGANIFSWDGAAWSPAVTASGFGNPLNYRIPSLLEYNGCLYAGTSNSGEPGGAEVFRYEGGTSWTMIADYNMWAPALLSSAATMTVYQGALWVGFEAAATASYDRSEVQEAGEVWKYECGEGVWTRLAYTGNPWTSYNTKIDSLLGTESYLFAGTSNSMTGAEVWKYPGSYWEAIGLPESGSIWPSTASIADCMAEGSVYVGITDYTVGDQVWKYSLNTYTWSQVGETGFEDPTTNNGGVIAMATFNGRVYAGTWNSTGGAKVFSIMAGDYYTLTIKRTPTAGGKVKYEVTTADQGVRADSGTCPTDCTPAFNQGETVTAEARPTTGNKFFQWLDQTGGLYSEDNPTTVYMDADKTLNAVFLPDVDYTLTVNISPAGSGTISSWPTGISCPDGSCTAQYPSGQLVYLDALYKPGYQFDHWEGDLVGTTTTGAVIYMTGNKTAAAVFIPVVEPRTLNVTVSPAGGGTVSSYPEGIGCPDDCTASHFPKDTTVVITAQYKPGYQFDHWEGDFTGPAPAISIKMDSTKNIKAVFVPVVNPQTLTVSVSPEGTGNVTVYPGDINCPDVCTGDYFPINSTVYLSANYNTGYRFDHWEGDLSPSTNQAETLTMNSNKNATAVFVADANPKTLTVEVSPEGSGRVASYPGGIDCPEEKCSAKFPENANVILTAEFNDGYQFDHWEETAVDRAAGKVKTVTMDSDKLVKAVFTPVVVSKRLTIAVSPTEGGNVYSIPAGINCPSGDECGADFPEGQEVKLIAVRASGYQFGGWQGDLSDGGNIVSVVMNADKNITALFNKTGESITRTKKMPAYSTLADYRILSVPVTLDYGGVSRSGAFDSEIGTYDSTTVRIGRWAPWAEPPDYIEYPDIQEDIVPGWAAWFLFKEARDFNFQGTATPTIIGPEGLEGHAVKIYQGWNQVGNPFDYPVLVERCLVIDQDERVARLLSPENDITQKVFWVWTGEYQAGVILGFADGGWLYKKTAGEGELFFPAARVSSGSDLTAVDADKDEEQPPSPPAASGGISVGAAKSSSDSGCFIQTAD
ncbi:MAG: hypothetical protein V1816_12795 [Pseudomonadota bacterium]